MTEFLRSLEWLAKVSVFLVGLQLLVTVMLILGAIIASMPS